LISVSNVDGPSKGRLGVFQLKGGSGSALLFILNRYDSLCNAACDRAARQRPEDDFSLNYISHATFSLSVAEGCIRVEELVFAF